MKYKKVRILIIISLVVFTMFGCNTDQENMVSGTEVSEQKTYKNYDKNEPTKDLEYYNELATDSNGNEGLYPYQSRVEELARIRGYYITIDDFYVEDKTNIPLNVTVLSTKQYNDLFAEIDYETNYGEEADGFRLFHLIQYNEWLSFRKALVDNDNNIYKDEIYEDEIYYCIVSDDKKTETAYLFFINSGTTYRCLDYLRTRTNGTGCEMNKTYRKENSYKQNSEYYKWIAECDR